MRPFALAIALTIPAQAFALSCIEPSVEFSYAAAAESDDTYLLGTGVLSFDQSLMPRSTVGVERPAPVTRIPGTISGKSFDGSGFNQDFEARVDLVVRCIQSWCPVVTNDKEHLVFMKEGETSYELAIDPCGGSAFPEPTKEMLDQVLTCFKDGNCSSDPS
jgi:hypothetical protein